MEADGEIVSTAISPETSHEVGDRLGVERQNILEGFRGESSQHRNRTVVSENIEPEADTPNDDVQRWSLRKVEESYYGDYDVLYPVESRGTGGRSTRPPIHRESALDGQGRRWSIEVLPTDETREDCQKRIAASWARLAATFGEGKLSVYPDKL
jgi:hypothetical protein